MAVSPSPEVLLEDVRRSTDDVAAVADLHVVPVCAVTVSAGAFAHEPGAYVDVGHDDDERDEVLVWEMQL